MNYKWIFVFFAGLSLGILVTWSSVEFSAYAQSKSKITVYDRNNVVKSAYSSCAYDETLALTKKVPSLPDLAIWEGQPCGEGTLEIICKDGSKHGIYVTGGLRTDLSIGPNCKTFELL